MGKLFKEEQINSFVYFGQDFFLRLSCSFMPIVMRILVELYKDMTTKHKTEFYFYVH